jgi:Leucine-rich repeat (LRR) protein
MQYIVGLKTVKSLTVGAAPESLGIEARSFALVGQMSQLESLRFCKRGPTDAELRPLTKLKCLAHLEIEGSGMAFFSLSADPDEHRLTDAAAIHLAAMETLQSLTIRSHEDFTDTLIEKLAALPKLRHLEIRSQRFTDKALGILGVEYDLRSLTINSQNCTDAGVKALCHASELEELEIHSSKVTARSIAHVKSLNKLRSLELPIERLDADTMATLAEMKSIERLLLRRVPITDVELIKLKNHPSLTTLFLESADLSIYSLDTFKSMPKLEYVNLGWNPRESRLQKRLNEYLKAKEAAKPK